MADGDGLENRCTGIPRTVGSNPTLSAKYKKKLSHNGKASF